MRTMTPMSLYAAWSRSTKRQRAVADMADLGWEGDLNATRKSRITTGA